MNNQRDNERRIVMLDAETIGEDINLDPLHTLGSATIHATTAPAETARRIRDAQIVIVNKVLVRADEIAAAKSLELICLTATGSNNIDIEAARGRSIAVTNVADYSTPSVVQHTFAMLLYLLEQVRAYDDYVRDGRYIQSSIFTHFEPYFSELAAMQWGIIGLGAIGSGVARIAEAFGAKVVYHSTSGRNANPQFKRLSLDELLRTSDIVSIHAPLNDSTRGLIGADQFALMKKSAILLNLGRGGIVDEKAAVRAIDSDTIYAFGTDVLAVEPMAVGSPFRSIRKRDRVLVTPHVAWGSRESRGRVITEVVENIRAYLRGERRNRLD